MEILKKIIIRLLYGITLFFLCNLIYSRWFYEKDVRKYSRLKYSIDSAFTEGEIIYMGESSNTSFNPWTDTLNYSISDFLQMYLPGKKVTAITHESFHPGLFLEMLNLLPHDNKKRTLVVTMNMRTCGPSAMYSSNEAANRQEALFYSNRLPLLTRIFLSLHFYDNRNENERKRMKVQHWRTQNLNVTGSENTPPTTKLWLEKLKSSEVPKQWNLVATAYVEEFAFILDEQNQRVKDLEKIAELCKSKNTELIFHLLPENRDYAELMFDKTLVNMMDRNADFLAEHFTKKGVKVINNYRISSGTQYTDQWYPTEHLNTELRHNIALSIAKTLDTGVQAGKLQLKANNFPDKSKQQPMADTLLRKVGVWRYK